MSELQIVQPVLDIFGIQEDEAVSMLETLENSKDGFQEGSYGVSLRRVIVVLSNPTKKALKVMKDMGIPRDKDRGSREVY